MNAVAAVAAAAADAAAAAGGSDCQPIENLYRRTRDADRVQTMTTRESDDDERRQHRPQAFEDRR